jgi:hypothetical protein
MYTVLFSNSETSNNLRRAHENVLGHQLNVAMLNDIVETGIPRGSLACNLVHSALFPWRGSFKYR